MIIWNNFSYSSMKPYVVSPHLNRLVETVQMRAHNVCFLPELTKIFPNYHQIILLIQSSAQLTEFQIRLFYDMSETSVGLAVSQGVLFNRNNSSEYNGRKKRKKRRQKKKWVGRRF